MHGANLKHNLHTLALAIGALALPALSGAQSTTGSVSTSGGAVTVTTTTNFGNNVSTTTECTVGTTMSAGGGLNGYNVGGSVSVGSGVSCANVTGYSDPNGYAQVETSCQSGNFASAAGQAGVNGVSFCGDASTGSSCSAGVAAGGISQYASYGANAGVSAGGEGVGACGGFTWGNGAVNVQYCGSLAYEVGVDFCVNYSVSYAPLLNRVEPFASRALAQVAKCAVAGTPQQNCTFTAADLMANAAAPYYRRTSAFFNQAGQLSVTSAASVWADNKSQLYRSTNYAKAATKFAGNKLQGTAYDAMGRVTNGAGQLVDVAKVTGDAFAQAGGTVAKGVATAANTVANGTAGAVGTVVAGTAGAIGTVGSGVSSGVDTVSSGLSSAGNSVGKAFKKIKKGW